MPTFLELKQQLAELSNRKAVLLMLMEHIDAEFRTIGGSAPKKAIKTDDGTLVPETTLESMSDELANGIRTADQQITDILNANVEVQPPPAPIAQA